MSLKTLKKKTQKKPLGRGLSALISTQAVSLYREPVHERQTSARYGRTGTVQSGVAGQAKEESLSRQKGVVDGVTFVPIDQVIPNPFQPRKDFSQDELGELAESIKAHGILQPVIVRESNESGGSKFEIVAGERRWRAAKLAGISHLPVLIRSFGDKDALEVALIENIQRSDLNPIEEARAFQVLMDEFSLSQQQIAEKVGKDRASIANYLRLLKLPPLVIEYIQNGKLSMGHAKAILTVKEPAAQISLAKRCVTEGLSVRRVEDIVERVVVLDAPKKTGVIRKSQAENAAFVSEINDKLRNALGTKVTLKHHRSGKGKIEILYFSEEELERLIDHICR